MRQKLKICVIVLLVAAILATFFQPLAMYAMSQLFPLEAVRTTTAQDDPNGFSSPMRPIAPLVSNTPATVIPPSTQLINQATPNAHPPEFIGPPQFIDFEPASITLGLAALAKVLKMALPYIGWAGMGVGVSMAANNVTNSQATQMFIERQGEVLSWAATGAGNAMGALWDAAITPPTSGTTADLFPQRHTLRDPITGEVRHAIQVPMSAMEAFMHEVQPGMAEFIGPIDMTGAEAAWAIGSPWMMRVPGKIFQSDLLIGVANGIPVVDLDRWNVATNVQRVELMKNFNIRNTNINGVEYRSGDVSVEHRSVCECCLGPSLETVVILGNFYVDGNIVMNTWGREKRYMSYNANENAISQANRSGLIIGQDRWGSRFIWSTVMYTLHTSSASTERIALGMGRPVVLTSPIEDKVLIPPFDLSLSPANIITSPTAAVAAVATAAGAVESDDPVYIWWPNSLEELMAMIDSAHGLSMSDVVLNPGEWIIDDDDNPPLWPPWGGIPQDWLDDIRDGVGGIRDGVGGIRDGLAGREAWEQDVRGELSEINTGVRALPVAIAAATVGPMQFNFNMPSGVFVTRFPFSIPFDFARMINSLNVPPQAPRWEIDFAGTVLDGERFGGPAASSGRGIFTESGMRGSRWVLDLKDFETIAFYIRWGIWILFAMGLMMLTSKVIRW